MSVAVSTGRQGANQVDVQMGDWRIIIIMLPDFSRSRLEDFLVSTSAFFI